MKRASLALLAVIGLALYAHRSAVHTAVTDTALAAGCLAGLALLAAAAAFLAGRRSHPAPVRQRPAVARPAAVSRPARPRPARCACGQPAAAAIEGRPACVLCAADYLAGQKQPDAGFTAPAGQPPVLLPDGETVGALDMTEFEERLS